MILVLLAQEVAAAPCRGQFYGERPIPVEGKSGKLKLGICSVSNDVWKYDTSKAEWARMGELLEGEIAGVIGDIEAVFSADERILALQLVAYEPTEDEPFSQIVVFDTVTWRRIATFSSDELAQMRQEASSISIRVWQSDDASWAFPTPVPIRYRVETEGKLTTLPLDKGDKREYRLRLETAYRDADQSCRDLGPDDEGVCSVRDILRSKIELLGVSQGK